MGLTSGLQAGHFMVKTFADPATLRQLKGVTRSIFLHENSYIILSHKGENLMFQNIGPFLWVFP